MTSTNTPRRPHPMCSRCPVEGMRPMPGARNPERHQIRWSDMRGKRCARMVESHDAAERELRAMLHAKDEGEPHAATRHTLRSWLPVWLETKSELRDRSRIRYDALLRHWMSAPIAARRLTEIEPEHVAGELSRMSRLGLSASTRASSLSILRMALEAALRAGYVRRNVVRLVDAPAVYARPVDPPRGADRVRLLGEIKRDRLEALWTIALYAGLRQGEILALRWQDVELESDPPIIHVRGSLEYATASVGRTKSRHGMRSLPVHAPVADALRRHRDKLPYTPHPTAWIFETATGRPLHARNVLGWWHELCARAGTRRYRMHDLRHAALTTLLETNDLLMVSRYAGHSTHKITGDVYAHIQLGGIRLEPGHVARSPGDVAGSEPSHRPDSSLQKDSQKPVAEIA